MTSKHLSFCMAVATCMVSAAAMAQPVVSQAVPAQASARVAQERCDQQQNRAGDCRRDRRARSGGDRRRYRADPVAVVTDSVPQHPAYGWQYFSDPRAVHAVVISPAGEYFLSRGRGMRQVTGPAGGALPG